MGRIVTVLALFLASAPALAKKRTKKADREASAAKDNSAAEPPAKRGIGSLWDFIEPGRTDKADTEMQQERALEEELLVDSPAMEDDVEAVDALKFHPEPQTLASTDDPLFLDAIDPSEFDIPIVVNDEVVKWMAYFVGRGRDYYAKWLARQGAFRPMMETRLEAAGLPKDLIYLSMIESGYSTHAYSRAAAVGLWQFMSYTARDYDLRVDWWIDERRDPQLATDAAIALLGDLNDRYDDWYLAWAGYNAGPGRVNKAIKATGTTDFWVIGKSGHVRAETANYVPKLLAAAIIGKHPERYGFTGIELHDPIAMDQIVVEGAATIDVLARCAGISVEEMKALNPHLRQGALPAGGKHRVNVPAQGSVTFLAALEQVPQNDRVTVRRHVVARGETLGTIASKYGTSVAAVQTMNDIRNVNRISVGAVLAIPTTGASSGKASTAKASTAKAPAAKSKPTSHTVSRGETLSAIASKYSVRSSDIQTWNKLGNANHIQVGQRLTIYGATIWSNYSVRSGDTLSEIARRNGCSVDEIRSWNGLNGTTIYPGQKLKVRQT